MKKRVRKKLAKQALAEVKNTKELRAISSKRLQDAMWKWLLHQPLHSISIEFWKEFYSKSGLESDYADVVQRLP